MIENRATNLVMRIGFFKAGLIIRPLVQLRSLHNTLINSAFQTI